MLNYKNSFFQTIRQKLFLLQEHCKRNLLQFIPCLAFHSNKQSWMRPGKKQASSCTGPAKVGSQPAVAITISRTPDSRSKSRSLQLLKLKLTLLIHGMGVPCLLSSFLPLPSFLPFFPASGQPSSQPCLISRFRDSGESDPLCTCPLYNSPAEKNV